MLPGGGIPAPWSIAPWGGCTLPKDSGLSDAFVRNSSFCGTMHDFGSRVITTTNKNSNPNSQDSELCTPAGKLSKTGNDRQSKHKQDSGARLYHIKLDKHRRCTPRHQHTEASKEHNTYQNCRRLNRETLSTHLLRKQPGPQWAKRLGSMPKRRRSGKDRTTHSGYLKKSLKQPKKKNKTARPATWLPAQAGGATAGAARPSWARRRHRRRVPPT